MINVAAKIQGLRTTFREEVRKIKKSEHTGSGSAEIYVPKWKFFNECLFLEDVVALNRPTCSNMQEAMENYNKEEDDDDHDDDILGKEANLETASTCSETSTDALKMHPKRRRKSSEENEWMKTAAGALTKLTQDSDDQQDEWDVFGMDVANSLRALKNSDCQRRAKFAVQYAIFQATEKAKSTVPTVSTLPVLDSFFKNLGN